MIGYYRARYNLIQQKPSRYSWAIYTFFHFPPTAVDRRGESKEAQIFLSSKSNEPSGEMTAIALHLAGVNLEPTPRPSYSRDNKQF